MTEEEKKNLALRFYYANNSEIKELSVASGNFTLTFEDGVSETRKKELQKQLDQALQTGVI